MLQCFNIPVKKGGKAKGPAKAAEFEEAAAQAHQEQEQAEEALMDGQLLIPRVNVPDVAGDYVEDDSKPAERKTLSRTREREPDIKTKSLAVIPPKDDRPGIDEGNQVAVESQQNLARSQL